MVEAKTWYKHNYFNFHAKCITTTLSHSIKVKCESVTYFQEIQYADSSEVPAIHFLHVYVPKHHVCLSQDTITDLEWKLSFLLHRTRIVWF